MGIPIAADGESGRRTAVLVIDMQNGFCNPHGVLATARGETYVKDAARVIANNAELLAAARAARLPIVYTRQVFRPGLTDASPRVLDRLQNTQPLIRQTSDAEIVDELAPRHDDWIVDKVRYDAFLYTDLELVLRSIGVRQLLVTGVATNVCVESTVRSADQRDLNVLVASDCTGASEGAHERALAAMSELFATVAPWRELLDGVVGADRQIA